jgi:hypothetical protein
MQRLALLVVVALLGGCFRVTYRSPSRTPADEHHAHRYSFFVLGLIGHADVHPGADCPQTGVARIASGVTVADALLTFVTIGIYTPRSVVITCAR